VLHQGDALEVLRGMESESVHCCVTSPPYWGLRDYGVAGQVGLEATPDEYVERVVAIFREVRRVLRADGTLWLNLGDSYASTGGHADTACNDRRGAYNLGNRPEHDYREFRQRPAGALKPKDLVGIPWRIAFALQADGWYLRSDVIWAKPNPMPESVADRPTKSHEYLFLLSKSERYYFDAEAVREAHATPEAKRATKTGRKAMAGQESIRARGNMEAADAERYWSPGGRNIRSVWTIPTAPFPEAHFAVFPPALVEPCIKAGTSERGCCAECGAPWKRVVERVGELDESRPQARRAIELARERGLTDEHLAAIRSAGITDSGKALVTQSGAGCNAERIEALAAEARTALGGYYREFLLDKGSTTGWRPTCDHDAEVESCTVLDPFAGSGTTGMVAARLGRTSVLIDLNPEYVAMQERRIVGDAPLWNRVEVRRPEDSR
jgi:DNA modification methylase